MASSWWWLNVGGTQAHCRQCLFWAGEPGCVGKQAQQARRSKAGKHCSSMVSAVVPSRVLPCLPLGDCDSGVCKPNKPFLKLPLVTMLYLNSRVRKTSSCSAQLHDTLKHFGSSLFEAWVCSLLVLNINNHSTVRMPWATLYINHYIILILF